MVSRKCVEMACAFQLDELKRNDMKKNTIIGIILTPILCIVVAQIISVGRENADSKFQKALADFENSSISKNDSGISVTKIEESPIVSSKINANLPTKEEIISTNAKLPVLVSDGTMFTKVDYNEKTMVQTFYYDFTRDFDESLITQDNISQMKGNMVNALKGTNSEDRLNAGVTYLYVYRSIDKEKLYEIRITANDLK